MTEGAPPVETRATCPDCAPFGLTEFLFEHGLRTFCTNPWCGYEVMRAAPPEPLDSGAQQPLF